MVEEFNLGINLTTNILRTLRVSVDAKKV